MAFDDYLRQEPLPGRTDPIRCPKISIDAFANIHSRKTSGLRAPPNKLYTRKSATDVAER